MTHIKNQNPTPLPSKNKPEIEKVAASTLLLSTAQHDLTVLCLTPLECERLQGMKDNHTRILWQGKAAEECPDAPRYKAISNSMAVPVMRWIGNRIKDFINIGCKAV